MNSQSRGKVPLGEGSVLMLSLIISSSPLFQEGSSFSSLKQMENEDFGKSSVSRDQVLPVNTLSPSLGAEGHIHQRMRCFLEGRNSLNLGALAGVTWTSGGQIFSRYCCFHVTFAQLVRLLLAALHFFYTLS